MILAPLMAGICTTGGIVAVLSSDAIPALAFFAGAAVFVTAWVRDVRKELRHG